MGNDRQVVYVRRRKNEAYNPECLVSTVKGGGGSLMAWASFSRQGPGPIHRVDGIMKADQYKHILSETMLPYARDSMPNEWSFQQDNDPKHTSKLVKAWMQEQHVSQLPWPSQSPDVNPIEHLWSDVDAVVRIKQPTNVRDLWTVVEQAWSNIPTARCRHLVDSMPRRVRAVIKAKGYPTKY